MLGLRGDDRDAICFRASAATDFDCHETLILQGTGMSRFEAFSYD